MAITLPTTIDKRRTVKVGGGARASREQFNIGVDLVTQGYDDIRAILRQTAAEATAEQLRANNPPTTVLVDGRQKNIQSAQYKIEIFFGAFIQRAAMVEIEVALHNAIKRSTRARTGALQNIRESWQWIHLTGTEARFLGGPQDITTFTNDDRLILAPKLKYAGIVNVLVGKKGKRFTTVAVDAVRGKSQFRALAVTSGVTLKNQLPGEYSKFGTPFISVKVSRGRRRR